MAVPSDFPENIHQKVHQGKVAIHWIEGIISYPTGW